MRISVVAYNCSYITLVVYITSVVVMFLLEKNIFTGLYKNKICMKSSLWFFDIMWVASNQFFGTLALFFLFSFSEISQGTGRKQPRNVIEGMFGLNLLRYSTPKERFCFVFIFASRFQFCVVPCGCKQAGLQTWPKLFLL